MDEQHFRSEKQLQPTYTAIELLRIIHDKGFDKHQLLQVMELLEMEAARFDIRDFKIIRWNLKKVQKKIEKKMMADAREGIYTPIRQMKDILPPKE